MSDQPIINNNLTRNFYHLPSDCPQCGKLSLYWTIGRLELFKNTLQTKVNNKFVEIKQNIEHCALEKTVDLLNKHKMTIIFATYYACVFVLIGFYLRLK